MSYACLSDRLYECVSSGNVDGALEIIKRGVNVNIIHSSGRTFLGKAAQLGDPGMVCLLLDAENFYSTSEDSGKLVATDDIFCPYLCSNCSEGKLPEQQNCCFLKSPKLSHPQSPYKCCSPSIDSETYVCSDEVWGHDASDTNTGQQSDVETTSCKNKSTINLSCNCHELLPSAPSKEDKVKIDDPIPTSSSTPSITTMPASTFSNISNCQAFAASRFAGGNIGYFVYEYREEEEGDTEDSSGPVVSSTEDSDSALIEPKQPSLPPPQRHSSILLHRTLGRGRGSNIVSSDSEFETENYHRRRHAKHYHHRTHRNYRDTVRSKVLVSAGQSSNPYFTHLHNECLNLGLDSPFSLKVACDINQHDAYGRSALHYATEQGHAYIVQVLITAGVKIDTLDADHMTPLHVATQKGMVEIINLLLDGGAKVNSKMNDKSSPLHIAASRGYTDIVEILLDRGAKLDSLDSSDRTPLLLAVSRSHLKVIQALIKRGAKVNIEEIHGYTPLCEAVWKKDIRVVQLLLKAGAKVTQSHYLIHYAVSHRCHHIVEMLLGARCIANLRDDAGDTPLIIAARSCQTGVIKLLLKHGANVNYPNGITGTLPLHEAVDMTRDAQHGDFLKVFSLLYCNEAKLDEESLLGGDTPLYRALMFKKRKAAALLIKHGCNVNNRAPVSGTDYLSMVAGQGHFALANLIILAGFKINSASWLTGPYTPGTLMAHLRLIKSRPLSLTDYCRICIRRQFGTKVFGCVSKLKLPLLMQRFLKMEDIPEGDI